MPLKRTLHNLYSASRHGPWIMKPLDLHCLPGPLNNAKLRQSHPKSHKNLAVLPSLIAHHYHPCQTKKDALAQSIKSSSSNKLSNKLSSLAPLTP
jgi:hypothetical protein